MRWSGEEALPRGRVAVAQALSNEPPIVSTVKPPVLAFLHCEVHCPPLRRSLSPEGDLRRSRAAAEIVAKERGKVKRWPPRSETGRETAIEKGDRAAGRFRGGTQKIGDTVWHPTVSEPGGEQRFSRWRNLESPAGVHRIHSDLSDGGCRPFLQGRARAQERGLSRTGIRAPVRWTAHLACAILRLLCTPCVGQAWAARRVEEGQESRTKGRLRLQYQ